MNNYNDGVSWCYDEYSNKIMCLTFYATDWYQDNNFMMIEALKEVLRRLKDVS